MVKKVRILLVVFLLLAGQAQVCDAWGGGNGASGDEGVGGGCSAGHTPLVFCLAIPFFFKKK